MREGEDLFLLELVEKVVKWINRCYEGVGYLLPVALVSGKL